MNGRKALPLLGEARNYWAMCPRDNKKGDSECIRNGSYIISAFVDEMYPNCEKIVLVIDNLNTNKPALYKKHLP